MLQVLNLKPMKLKKDATYTRAPLQKQPPKAEKQPEKEEMSLKTLSFDIKDMKQRYIFPFNENFKRKLNYRLKDGQSTLEPEQEDSTVIYEAKVFQFPFTQVKLSIKVLKELQSPISTKLSDIAIFLDKYYQEFPTSIFPITTQPVASKKQIFSSFMEKAEQP